MTILTVALPLVRPTVGTEFSHVLSDDRRNVLGHGTAPLALLPAADTLVLVAPARALSWHTVKLPPMSASRLRAALEGVLEDRLLDEPGNLAFAIGPQRDPDGTVTVAVCDKSWLRAALDFFESAQRPATRVVPEFSPAGADAPQRHVFVTGTAGDAWIALVEERSVLCVPLSAAALFLDARTEQLDGVSALAEPAVAALAEQMLARTVEIQPVAQRLLASGDCAWELAQLDLSTSSGGRMARRWGKAWQPFLHGATWRPIRWGLVALIVANLAGLNAWAWSQEAAVQDKRAQIKALFSRTFPRVKTIVDPSLQMERELALLRQSTGALSGRDMETMLGAVGAVLPQGRNARAIEFSPGEAALQGVGLDAAELALVSGKLTGLGYSVRLDGERLVVRAGGR